MSLHPSTRVQRKLYVYHLRYNFKRSKRPPRRCTKTGTTTLTAELAAAVVADPITLVSAVIDFDPPSHINPAILFHPSALAFDGPAIFCQWVRSKIRLLQSPLLPYMVPPPCRRVLIIRHHYPHRCRADSCCRNDVFPSFFGPFLR